MSGGESQKEQALAVEVEFSDGAGVSKLRRSSSALHPRLTDPRTILPVCLSSRANTSLFFVRRIIADELFNAKISTANCLLL